MKATRTEARRRRVLPWALLAGAAAVCLLGGWTGSHSISALVERTSQLEREAAESEARVAELQALRDALSRKLRTLEQQHQEAQAAAVTAAVATACTQPTPPAQGRAESRSAARTTSARGKKVARR